MKAAPTPTPGVAGSSLPTYDSEREPPSWWAEAVELWRYRDLVSQMVARDIKVRYKRSFLGVAWTMLNPVLMTIVYTVAFSHILHIDSPTYAVFLLSGTVAWGFFAQSTVQAMYQLLGSGPLLTRIYVPRAVFAVSASIVGLVNLVLALIPLIVLMLVTGAPFGRSLAWLPISLVLLASFTLGLSLLMSALALQFYDVVDIYQVLLSAWFFWTPIVYPPTLIPGDQSWRSLLNPMAHLIELFRAPIYEGRAPDGQSVVLATVFSVVALVVGWVYFTRHVDDLAYRL